MQVGFVFRSFSISQNFSIVGGIIQANLDFRVELVDLDVLEGVDVDDLGHGDAGVTRVLELEALAALAAAVVERSLQEGLLGDAPEKNSQL